MWSVKGAESRTMKPNTYCLVLFALLICFALSPMLQAQNQNTRFGVQALDNNTTGDKNTAIGFKAMTDNRAGSFSTATGFQALSNNTTGDGNTATGSFALATNTTGIQNTATGGGALQDNIRGSLNTATGANALGSNTTGGFNTATGNIALFSNSDGNRNTALGDHAMFRNVHGSTNTAIGYTALINNTTGNFNVAIGDGAGSDVTTANDVICIGHGVTGDNVSGTCYIGNIHGVGINPSALPVLIDSAGKLGTRFSSERFKRDIKPMGKASEAILALKPVAFHYKSDDTNIPQFGLIAEEVEKVNPDLVVREKGEIYTVRYDAVNAMLLNEFLKEHRKNQEQEATIAKQQKQIDALRNGLQKVSAQLEMSKSAPQTVLNNQ
jgi:Chaperone of endosialidase